MRELRFEDLLFSDYHENDNEEALKQLIILVNQWLYGIIISFIYDSKKTEDILDLIAELIVLNRNKYNIKKRSITYELYLLAKKEIQKEL